MAEETDLSRTEPASPRRLQEARGAGDVPRSAELNAWVTLLAALGMLGWLAPRLVAALRSVTETALAHAAQPLAPAFLDSLQTLLWAVLPVLSVIFVAALVAPLLLSGWVFAPQIAQADLTRANPWKPLARLFSADSWFDFVSGLLKLLIAAAAVWWALAGGWDALQPRVDLQRGGAPDAAFAWVARGLMALAAGLTLAAVLDAGWRWWRYLRRHAMTWQEMLAEARESGVSPEIRAQLSSRQQQAAQRPLARAGEGTSTEPKAIDEVIG